MTLHISVLVEAIAAVHLAGYVEESQWPERGGLMLVGPPGTLKSTLLQILDRTYSDVLVISDLNLRSLAQLRDEIAAGKIRTLVFPEIAKLFERKAETSSAVEGVLRALASEGFTSAGFEDSRISRFTARASVIAALTPSFQRKKFDDWTETGFSRRFLWSFITLSDAQVIERALVEWQRLSFRVGHLPPLPVSGTIPMLSTRAERERCRILVKYQPGGDNALQLQLLMKMISVLRWWYREMGDPRNAFDTVLSFAETLGRQGGQIDLDAPSKNSSQKQSAERKRADRAERTAAARRLAKARVTSRRRK